MNWGAEMMDTDNPDRSSTVERQEATTAADGGQSVSGGLNLSSLAYKSISEMITHRRLRGGEAIVEKRLADALGVSRTPMREALQRLEGEGLVQKTANRSYVVRKVDLREYLESLKVRELLEPEAAVLAMGHIAPGTFQAVRLELEQLQSATKYHPDAHGTSDNNLHNMFADACGNTVLAETIGALRTTTRLFEIDRLADRVVPDSTEHLEILSAIEAQDKAAARKAVRTHIRSLMRFATQILRQ